MADKTRDIEITKRSTTIDNATGDVQKTIGGTVKGFGTGLREHVAKTSGVAIIDVGVATGQLPAAEDGTPGKWAIQILVKSFETQKDANLFSDRLVPIVEGFCGKPALKVN